MKYKLLLLFFLSTTLYAFAQETVVTEEKEDNSLAGQFEKMHRTSTGFQTFKVIDKDVLQKLKSNVLDSIKSYKNLVSTNENLLITERENIEQLNLSLNKTKLELETLQQQENSISFLGAQLNKNTYNLILWTIVILLALGLGFFAFKFSRSNILTNQARNNLLDIEQELELYRKKSIEIQQKLGRELQDEINKHRNS
ncbi:hypothetical protein [uncultured Polaribacter sp.]|uniref:hypothetical protein n=1 Tax=uncultured Polaribacter sp. TaxID=174711 RepID=UPI0030D8822D|tara:strand:- start:4300 stop:4893 length:594 start_codon:yes stop_codon:yes gene_type:complete